VAGKTVGFFLGEKSEPQFFEEGKCETSDEKNVFSSQKKNGVMYLDMTERSRASNRGGGRPISYFWRGD